MTTIVILILNILILSLLGLVSSYNSYGDDMIPLNDGAFKCGGWGVFGCGQGYFECTCPGNLMPAYISIQCCKESYFPPKCTICKNETNCERFESCHSCRTKVMDTDMGGCITCPKGFQLGSRGDCKTDINECETRNGGCEHSCFNTIGSYRCTCNDGYRLAYDRHSCQPHNCGHPGEIKNGRLEPGFWITDTFARYQCNSPQYAMIGPKFLLCKPVVASEKSEWDDFPPQCIDKCWNFPGNDSRQCGNNGISKKDCIWRGCCYNDENKYCHLYNERFYSRYRKTVEMDKFSYTSTKRDVSSCKYECDSIGECKGFEIKKAKMEEESPIIQNETCNFVQHILSPKLTEPGVFHSALNIKDDRIVAENDDLNLVMNHHIGCFSKDDMKIRMYFPSSKEMTVKSCLILCKNMLLSYAAMTNGSTCACTDNIPTHQSDNCTSEKDQMPSGGPEHYSLYKGIRNSRYLGCFNVKKNRYHMINLEEDDSRSVMNCISACGAIGFTYAALYNGSECLCSDEFNKIFVNEDFCNATCTDGSIFANCGGEDGLAVYTSPKKADISENKKISRNIEGMYETTGSLWGFSSQAFNWFSRLTTIATYNFLLHTDAILSKDMVDNNFEKSFDLCGSIYLDEHSGDVDSEIVLRNFTLRTSFLSKLLERNTKHISVYTQILIIDDDIEIENSKLLLKSSYVVIDFEQFQQISFTNKPDLGFDPSKVVNECHPKRDLIFQKQSFMCAEALIQSSEEQYIATAMDILSSIASYKCPNPEMRAFASYARTALASDIELMNLHIHRIPIYTKSRMCVLMSTVYDAISVYKQTYDRILSETNNIQFLKSAMQIESIYSMVVVAESTGVFEDLQRQYRKSSVTYERIKKNYENTLIYLEHVSEIYLSSLKETETGYDVFQLIFNAVKDAGIGITNRDWNKVAMGIIDFMEDYSMLQTRINDMARVIGTVKRLTGKSEEMIRNIAEVDSKFDFDNYMDDIEDAIKLQMNLYIWKDMRATIYHFLYDQKALTKNGALMYIDAITNLANWGQSLTKAMVEKGEFLRNMLALRAAMITKKKTSDDIKSLILRQRHGENIKNELLVEITEQTYDVRLELNYILKTFCQVYLYENLVPCGENYKPSLVGTMSQLLMKIKAAQHDSLLETKSIPSTVKRSIVLKNQDQCDGYISMTTCPVNYLKKNRALTFTVEVNATNFNDLARFRIAGISVEVVGAKASNDQEDLFIYIDSSGNFVSKVDNEKVLSFISKPLSLGYEYNVVNGYVSVYADVHNSMREAVSHITPFATWVLTVSDIRSKDIDLSNVSEIIVSFEGSAVPIE